MNRVGLKDYLLNEASDNDLLDCAKAYDAANQYGHFDTYDSVEEAAKLCGWDVETALSESRHVESNAERDRSNDVDLGSLAMLLSGSDVISTQSVPELLETMADRFGIEPEERALNADRARAEECIRTGVPDIQVEIDSTNDDNFIEGTVTVEGESCYFYRPNSTRSTEDYDSVILEPFRPDGYEGDIEDVALPAVIEENREIVELVVSVATAPYMDPDKASERGLGLDEICDEKTEVSESMRYGMEGVGLPMLDAAEHLMNY